MAEFALAAALVFIPLVFGIIEFGRLVWAKTTIAAAAREGVRYTVVHGSTSGAVADSAAVANYVINRTPLAPIGVKTTWADSNEPGDSATVQVTYVYTPIVRVIPSKTITSKSTQIINF
jgi:Flp pilus assembly protein TadG